MDVAGDEVSTTARPSLGGGCNRPPTLGDVDEPVIWSLAFRRFGCAQDANLKTRPNRSFFYLVHCYS